MNAREPSRTIHSIRMLLLLLSTTLLLSTNAASALAAQVDTRLLAVNYVDNLVENADLAAASSMLSTDSVLHTPEGVFQGTSGTGEFAATLNASFSSLDFSIERTDIAGDMAVIQFTLTGIHIGSYMNLQARCADIAVPGVVVLAFIGGTIDEQWISYDQETIRSQILAFNAIDESSRPTCWDTLSLSHIAPNPHHLLPCITANQCDTMSRPIAVPTADPAVAPNCISTNPC